MEQIFKGYEKIFENEIKGYMYMNEKLVSVVIRTCNRPHILRETLESVRRQTYPNIEVVIAEDGSNTAQKMLMEEFSDLNIRYACTGECKGRTIAGNMALSMTTGAYLNFLDDDDLLFPEHIQELVKVLDGAKEKVAYSIAYESIVQYQKEKKYYKEYRRKIRYQQPFNRTYLTFHNYLPIQSVMFSRELYEELGGFDEKLDILEDWDIWVRYSMKTDFIYVDKITSLYRVPLKQVKRDAQMYHAFEKVTKKFEAYSKYMNYYEVNRDLKYICEEIKTPKWKKKLKELRNKILY